ncbi:MAG: class I SAM-dependent methyltransferase [Candidatus Limnocylindrales bacterium]
MDHPDHVALIRGGVEPGGHWGDLGSGRGAFTLALAELLGPTGRILSVDRDAASLRDQALAMALRFPAVRLDQVAADFLGDLGVSGLDGIVMANSLHFEADRERAVRHVRQMLRAGGRLVLVEYDTDRGNQWVPHPLSFTTWRSMALTCGLAEPRLLGRVASGFLGAIYAAVTERTVDADDVATRRRGGPSGASVTAPDPVAPDRRREG